MGLRLATYPPGRRQTAKRFDLPASSVEALTAHKFVEQVAHRSVVRGSAVAPPKSYSSKRNRLIDIISRATLGRPRHKTTDQWRHPRDVHAQRLGGAEALLARPDIALTPAGKEGKGIVLGAHALFGMGPRALQAVRWLVQQIHPAEALRKAGLQTRRGLPNCEQAPKIRGLRP